MIVEYTCQLLIPSVQGEIPWGGHDAGIRVEPFAFGQMPVAPRPDRRTICRAYDLGWQSRLLAIASDHLCRIRLQLLDEYGPDCT